MRRFRRLIGTSTAVLILSCGLMLKSGCGFNLDHIEEEGGLIAGGLLAAILLFANSDTGGTGGSGNGAGGTTDATGDTGAGDDATAGAPADGRDGVDGVNCWDLNGDNIADVETEDTNGDGTVDVHDCRGGDGAVGVQGPVGPVGPQGPQGETGDPGADGSNGADGADGADGSDGDPGIDGDPGKSVKGDPGVNGQACWDLNDNGSGDLDTEDTNGDGAVDVLDCRGPSFFDIFIDDFFGTPDRLEGALGVPFVELTEPVLGGMRFDDTGRSGIALAYRVAIPVQYTKGNDVTMRLFFHRTGSFDDECFKFQVDRALLRDGDDVVLYEDDPRYVTIDDMTGTGTVTRGLAGLLGEGGDEEPEEEGMTLVIDLPVNVGETVACDGRMDGLGFWNDDLKVADLIAFQLSVSVVDLVTKYDNVEYHLLGVEFFEGPKGTAEVRGARIFDHEHPDPPCGDLGDSDCNGNGIPDECDLLDCDGSPWCSDCNENGTLDECDLCDSGLGTDRRAIAADMPRNFTELTADLLILDSTVSGGASSNEAAKADALGLTYDIVDAATWGAMNTADFASYKAIVLGDPTCGGLGPADAAEANTAVWGPAVTGNVVINGTDPTYHSSFGPGGAEGGDELTEKSIAFAAAEPGKTGAYVSLSCYYHGTSPGTSVPLLDAFVPGGFTVTEVPGCFNNAHIVATHPSLDGLTDANLSNWDCSVHEAFDSWPVSFQVLAIAVTGSEYTAPDGTIGTPYILGRGLTVISDIDLAPLTAENPPGTEHTVTATVVEDDVPQAGVEVTFTVIDGPHVGTTGTATTDNSGQASFTYSGTGAGLDTIHATFVDGLGRTQTSNTVTKEWVAADCSQDCNHDGIPDECQELECGTDSDCEDDDECTDDFCDGCVCVHIDTGAGGGPGIDTDDHVFIWDADTLRVSDIDTLGPIADFAGSATTCGGSSDSCGGFDDGRHMVFDTAGQRIFVSDHDSQFLVYDSSANPMVVDWSGLGLSEPLGIAPLPNGQLLITDEEDASGLFRIHADLTLDIGITSSRFDGAEGVVYDSVHDVIYVADEDDGEIEIFDGSTLNLLGAVPFCGSDGPYWLGVDGSSNRLFVLADSRCNVGGEGTARGLHVFDIGCRPGDLSYVTTFVGSGEPGSDCFGTLAVSESTDRLFAIDYCNDTVAIFDTMTLESLGSVPVDRAGEVPLMVSVGHLNDLVLEDN